MSVVIVERIWDQKHTGEELLAIYRGTSWCFRAHGVRSRVHILAEDGLRGWCLLDAPDAEAVRTTRRHLGVPEAERLWPATVLGPVRDVPGLSRRIAEIGDGAATVLVERSFAAPVRLDDLGEVERRGVGCLDRNGVALLMRLVSQDGRRMLCLCEAPDAAAVHSANAELGLPFDQAWNATIHFDG